VLTDADEDELAEFFLFVVPAVRIAGAIGIVDIDSEGFSERSGAMVSFVYQSPSLKR